METDTYLSVVMMIPLGLLLLFLWLKKRGSLRPKHRLSEEAMKELEEVLEEYRQVIAEQTAPIRDIRTLPHPQETIKQYLQIVIGLAALNKEPIDALTPDYYLLAHFQHIDDGDQKLLEVLENRPFTAQEATGKLPAQAGEGNLTLDTGLSGVKQKYLDRIAADEVLLEKELEAFLKRKVLF
jgi:hypothetical protein